MAANPAALLVEDEALVALVAEDHLRSLGFDPISAESGAEALALIDGQASPFTLAMIDVGLPDMRGDDLAQTLRTRLPNAKIILASGYDPAAFQQRFGGDQSVRVITKPYSEEDVRRAATALGFSA